MLEDVKAGEEVEEEYVVPAVLVTQENVDEYLE